MSENKYNTNNVPNLGQLKKALMRSHGEVSDLAALVVGTIEDLILQADINIPTSAWVANTDSAVRNEGYNYMADIAVPRLIENANVNVTLAIPSLAVASEAEMCQTAHVSAGSIRFFAKSIPGSALAGKLDAVQLDDSEQGG